jgi:hypothetical protein
MAQLKRLGPLSVAKVQAILMAFIGLIEGAIFAALGSLMPAEAGFGFGALSIVIFPVLFAVFGFLFGALSAWLYNVVAGWVGGIEVEFEK